MSHSQSVNASPLTVATVISKIGGQMSVGADWIAGGPQGHYPQTVQLSGDEWAVLQAYANRPPQTTTEIVDALEAAANELWSIPMASTRVLDQVRAALRKVRP